MSELVQEKVKILLVDDQALFREGVARLLGAEPEFEVAGDCGSVEDALQVLEQKSIDIVLLDFYLGERDGKEFLRLARERGFAGKVLLVTAGVHQREVVDLIRAGVSGIFLTRDSASLLAQVIRYVLAGGLWFNQEQLQSAMNPYTQERLALDTVDGEWRSECPTKWNFSNSFMTGSTPAIWRLCSQPCTDVMWANGMEGGHVRGRDAMRSYWRRQWVMIDPHVEPVAFSTSPDGEVVVEVHQIVGNLQGNVLADQMVGHIFRIEDGLVKRFDIRGHKAKVLLSCSATTEEEQSGKSGPPERPTS